MSRNKIGGVRVVEVTRVWERTRRALPLRRRVLGPHTELVHGPTPWYDGHEGREIVLNLMTHPRPQPVCVHAWMSERETQNQERLRPDVAGYIPVKTATCCPCHVGRDRRHTHTHFEYDGHCSRRVSTDLLTLRGVLPNGNSTRSNSPDCWPQCLRRTLDSTALYLSSTE